MIIFQNILETYDGYHILPFIINFIFIKDLLFLLILI